MATRTFGVEEELLLVNPADGRPEPTGSSVLERAGERFSRQGRADDPPSIDHEFKAEQAEIGSRPTTSAAELARDLRYLRRELAGAAAAAGVQVAALATSPAKVRPTVTPDGRYQRMVDQFGLLARQQLTCGQHVHVSIESRTEGVAVLDRIAPWLPVITAISANSPFWQAQDSGYASYRTVVWGLWPTAGPTAGFGDEAGYDTVIADLLGSGAAMDDGMIYFDARLSARYPTVEIRVADVCTDVDDAVFLAVLCRALVEFAAREWQAGQPPLQLRPELHGQQHRAVLKSREEAKCEYDGLLSLQPWRWVYVRSPSPLRALMPLHRSGTETAGAGGAQKQHVVLHEWVMLLGSRIRLIPRI